MHASVSRVHFIWSQLNINIAKNIVLPLWRGFCSVYPLFLKHPVEQMTNNLCNWGKMNIFSTNLLSKK